MPTILFQIDRAFRDAIRAAFGINAEPLVAVSQNEQFGDYQSNAAMGLAKQLAQTQQLKTNPRAVAEQIIAKLELGQMASDVTIAGPGFINVRLSRSWLAKHLQNVATHDHLGAERASPARTVVVDYSGPNIAKQMHVGHLRSTIIGDAIARVGAFLGHHIIRQNHIGDWGLQMGMVTWAVEHSSEPINSLAQLEALYREVNKASEDPAVRKQMIEQTRQLQKTPKNELTAWNAVRDLTLHSAQEIYKLLDVSLTPADVRGESSYSDEYPTLIETLVEKGVARETDGAIGIFPPGFANKEGEPRPFLIQSRDGTYQYPTFDLAALQYRVSHLHAERIIYTHDSRQAEHFAMLFAVAKMLGLDHVKGHLVQFDYAPFGTVLGEDNKPLKTRAGENVKLIDLLVEAQQRADALVKEKSPDMPAEEQGQIAHAVGVGAVKYADLSKDRTSDYVFSWDKMLALDGNTAPYLQYAHARICSIFRKMQESESLENLAVPASVLGGQVFVAAVPYQHGHSGEIHLEHDMELALARHVARFPEVIDLVWRELKPHHLCSYLYELAARFSRFFENCPVLKSEEPTRTSRLSLCDLTARTLATGLTLLGIAVPPRM